jgi:hypothetical protein
MRGYTEDDRERLESLFKKLKEEMMGILQKNPKPQSLLIESSALRDWASPEEDKAWKDL